MNIAKCLCKDCELEVWKEYDKCVLHCPKNIYQKDRYDDTLSSFYEELKKYIINTLIIEHTCEYEEIDDKLTSGEITSNNLERSELKECLFVPVGIVFPKRDGRDSFDYLKLLNLFGEIHFNYCEFYQTYLKLVHVKVFFQDCIFHDKWSIVNYDILENEDNVIYQTCEFKNMVSARNTEDDTRMKLVYSQFDYTCKFNKGIELDAVELEKQLFETQQDNYLENYTIPSIKLDNCIFDGKLILNTSSIENFTVSKSIFNNKFEFKNNRIENFNIDDSNFKKFVDCFGTKFQKFKIYKSIFNDFAGFEQCEFGSWGVSEECISHFEYVTFLDFTNFRNTKFKSGLDIENINFKEYPNFLNTEIDEFNTNRETFRVLKYSFDKNGNYLEGNKYFSLEMKKYGEELYLSPLKGNVQEKLVFWVNEKVSNFGQSWGRPVAWIILFIIIYGLIIYGNEHDWLMSISPKGSELLNTIVHWLNYPLKEFRPLEKILKKDYEFVSLFFNIIFSILIWQTIVAVKRYSRR